MFCDVLTPLRSMRTAALAVALVLSFATGSAQAAEKGVVPDLTWGTSRSEQDQTGTLMQAAGVRWSRINISWSWVNPSPGTFDPQVWQHYDRAVNTARNAGSKVILMVQQAPQWASGTTAKEGTPRDPATYAAFLQVLLQRYAGKVEALEVWNEENDVRFWPQGVNPGEYANLLKMSYLAVKATAPTVKVVFGGLAYNDYSFVERAYAAMPDLGSYFDVMAVHPYTHHAAPPELYWRDANGRIDPGAFAGYREVRASMAARGSDKPIWFTEFGWATTSQPVLNSGVAEAVQGDYLTRAYRCLEQDSYVQVATWYNLRNNYWAGNADTWEDQLGLVRTDFSPKPALDAFRNYSPGAGGCSYHEASASEAAAAAPADAPTNPREATPSTSNPSTERRATVVRITRVSPVRQAVSARVLTARSARPKFSISGVLKDASGSRVTLRFQRLVNKRWKAFAVRGTKVTNGRFTLMTGVLPHGIWRVRVEYAGSRTDLPSRSRYTPFRVLRTLR